MSEEPVDNSPIQQGIEHGPWLPQDESERAGRALEIFKKTGFLPNTHADIATGTAPSSASKTESSLSDTELMEEEHQLKEHLQSIREVGMDSESKEGVDLYWERQGEIVDPIRDRLQAIEETYEARAAEPGYKISPERMFETFTSDQQRFGAGMVDYVFGLASEDDRNRLYKRYYGRTDSPNYLEPEESQPVITYAFNKVDEAFIEEVRVRNQLKPEGVSLEELQKGELEMMDNLYQRYDRLLGCTGNGPNDETFTHAYPVIRNIFRSAGTIAKSQGNNELLKTWQDRWTNFLRQRIDSHEIVADMEGEYQIREELYRDFQAQPERQDLWDTAAEELLVEESYGEVYTTMADVPASSLIDLSRRIRNALPEDYWTIMAEVSPTGESWMDTLPQIKHDTSVHGMRMFTDMLIPEGVELSESSSKKWGTVVEIGAKNGELTDWFSLEGRQESATNPGSYRTGDPIADHYIIAEPNQALLGLARQKLDGRKNVDFLQSDVGQIPLADAAADMVMGDKVLPSLDRGKTRELFGELSRILKDGGVFIDGTRPQNLDKIDRTVSNRWKNLLAQMITDTVTDAVAKRDSFTDEEMLALAQEYGFRRYSYNMQGHNTVVGVYVKGRELKDAGYHAVQGKGVKHLLRVVKPELAENLG